MATAASTTADSATTTPTSGRLLSLDVFRGITILAMILVNNPASWGKKYQYWPLEHADWHGWTPTDLVFPFFLFIVGTALAYSMRKYRDGAHVSSAVYWRIIRRTALLIFLGWFPSLLARALAYFNGTAETIHLDTLRIYGVLVRIAIVYFFTSLIVLHIPLRGQIGLAVVILLGYWAAFAFLPDRQDYWKNLSNEGNFIAAFDRATIGAPHMYTYDAKTQRLREPTEPEGLLSTLPAIVTALLGYWTGLIIQRRGVNYRTVATLAACGLALAALGQLWHFGFPINKKIWTSSFVLLTGGLAMIMLAGCIMKFDIWGWRWLARPFELVGINAIFVFVGSSLFSTYVLGAKVGSHTIHDWIHHSLLESWIHDPKLASLCYALMIVSFWWLVCWVMSRFGWSVRV